MPGGWILSTSTACRLPPRQRARSRCVPLPGQVSISLLGRLGNAGLSSTEGIRVQSRQAHVRVQPQYCWGLAEVGRWPGGCHFNRHPQWCAVARRVGRLCRPWRQMWRSYGEQRAHGHAPGAVADGGLECMEWRRACIFPAAICIWSQEWRKWDAERPYDAPEMALMGTFPGLEEARDTRDYLRIFSKNLVLCRYLCYFT